jgi:hypothetical protein
MTKEAVKGITGSPETTAILYVQHYCLFCRLTEPLLRLFARNLGVTLKVYKLSRDGQARQVNGPDHHDAGWVPAAPCLVVGSRAYIGLRAIPLAFIHGGTK